MSTLKEALAPVAAVPGISQTDADFLYVLFYRQGMNPHPIFTFFTLKTNDMRKVVDRTKKHCDLMGFRFIHVRPAITDLDKEEKKQNGDFAG